MNKAIAVILILCGAAVIVTQLVEMVNDRPVLLGIGCLFFVGGLVGLLRSRPGIAMGRQG